MAERGRPTHHLREHHLLSGLGLQVLVVALLVFVYTQAARQLNYQRGLFLRLQEQMAAAKMRVAKAGKPDLQKIRAEVDHLAARLVTPEMLSEIAKDLESSAKERFGFHRVTLKVGTVEKAIRLDLGEKESFEVRLVALEFQGAGSTRNAAAFLTGLTSSEAKPLCPLYSMQLEQQSPDQPDPVLLRLKWLVAVGSEQNRPAESRPSFGSSGQKQGPPLVWGRREEPFVSPFVSPRAIQISPALRQRFRLSGIVWDAKTPTCVINGTVLKAGDLLDGYQVILIAQNAVLLRKGEEEIFIPIP